MAPHTRQVGICNLVSNNHGMRWRIDDVAAALSYMPLDISMPVETGESPERAESALHPRRLVKKAEPLVIRQRW
jgi:hypothetical protein